MVNPITRVNDGSQPVTDKGKAVRVTSPTANPTVETPESTNPQDVAGGNPVADLAKVKAAITRLNVHAQNLQRTLSFSIDDATGRTVIRVYDTETKELIREIPPDETIRMAQDIARYNSSHLIQGQQA